MRVVFYLLLGFILIALQTAVISGLPAIMTFYDMIIPFVIYFSLFRRFSVGFAVILVLGLVVDMISGAPNGLYLTVFMVIFFLFRNIANFFHARKIVLFTFCTGIGVFIENLVFFVFHIFSETSFSTSLNHLQMMVIQIAWVFLTAPILYRLLSVYFSQVDRLSNRFGSSYSMKQDNDAFM